MIARARVPALAAAVAFVAFAGAPQPVALAAIHAYQATLSPLLARAGVQCRFTTSCSRYAETVIARDGVVAGGWRAMWRIGRCGPWTPRGTVDDAN